MHDRNDNSEGLYPPPPDDSNAIRVCKISFFGAPTGATLSVARVARDGGATTTVSQPTGWTTMERRSAAGPIDWIYHLAFVGYLVVMIGNAEGPLARASSK